MTIRDSVVTPADSSATRKEVTTQGANSARGPRITRCSRSGRRIGAGTFWPPPLRETVFDCDLHTHSRFFHLRPEVASGFDPIGVRLLRRLARRRGLDGLAITNHDCFREDTLPDDTFLPGIEISTTAGHLLVVGPDPPTHTRPGELDPTSAVELGCSWVTGTRRGEIGEGICIGAFSLSFDET